MKLIIINGPNINMLGIREPDVYGSKTYKDLLATIYEYANNHNISVTCFQSNHEGAIVDCIQQAYGNYDGIVINPAAYTHTSIAILDALKAVCLPAVEVHISDLDGREPFRQVSYAGLACEKTVKGQGFDGYCQAIAYLKAKYENSGC